MKKPDNRRKNKLTPAMEAAKFKPGQSGNPGGRPKASLITQRLREMLSEGDADLIAERLIKQAKAGDTKSSDLILERTEGKVSQSVDMISGGKPLSAPVLNVTFVNAPDPVSR